MLPTAVYKSGTGTRGRGHGMRVWGLGDARLGTWGHQVWDAGTCGTGTIMIIEKVGGKCDISHFSCEYVLVKATYPALLNRVPSMPVYEANTRRRSPALKKVKP